MGPVNRDSTGPIYNPVRPGLSQGQFWRGYFGRARNHTNVATGVTNSVVTNETGNYTFTLVPVGNYDVKVDMSGFKAEEAKGLRVETAAQVRQDFQLQVGAVSEVVEVAASSVLLNTETANVGGVIENKRNGVCASLR